MREYYWIFKNMPLFKDIPIDKYDDFLHCLQAQIKEYDKGEVIVGLYNEIESAGIILSGKVHIILYSQYGTEHNVHHLQEGYLFGETFTYTYEDTNLFEIIASEKSKILFLCLTQLIRDKTISCPYVSQITLNLLNEAMRKNYFLNKKVEILCQRKIRDKVCIYLKMLQGTGSTISIPLNRQEMADFLGVDRSALSRELCKMRDEGIIKFNKNKFIILNSKWL